MTSEDLRRQNASLHDRIKQVLEKHPELRDGTELVALSQDLHVEVGAPFLERTRDRLLERVKAITKDRPELEHYFDDLTSLANASRDITPREIELSAALGANVALRVQAERLIAAYLEPNSDRSAVINGLITLFDGPAQREAQMLAADAMGGVEGSRPSPGRVDPPRVADLSGGLPSSLDGVRPLEDVAPRRSVRRSHGMSPPE
jgi:hypothetical protein